MARLWLRVENSSKHVRGRKRAREGIERFVLAPYAARKLEGDEYQLEIKYEIPGEASRWAEERHCFVESEAWEVGTERR